VIANVAIERFTSVIKFSISRLHVVTHCGWVIAILLSVRTAAKRTVALAELKNNCNTVVTPTNQPTNQSVNDRFDRQPFIAVTIRMIIPEIAGVNSFGVTFFKPQIARAASKITISLFCRRHDSKYSINTRSLPRSSTTTTTTFTLSQLRTLKTPTRACLDIQLIHFRQHLRGKADQQAMSKW
jgi:hypothetical protein